MKHHPASPNCVSRFNLIGNANFEATTLIAAAALQAVGSIQEGNAKSSAYKREAQASEENARIARSNAERTASAYSQKEDNLRRSQKLALGRQRAAAAESNVGVNVGSNLDIQTEDTAQAELDALTLRYEGNNARTNELNRGIQYSNAAETSRTNAKTARRAGYMGALTSVAKGAKEYNNYNEARDQYKAPDNELPWLGSVRNGSMARNSAVKKYDWET
jgi:hypothetical protein